MAPLGGYSSGNARVNNSDTERPRPAFIIIGPMKYWIFQNNQVLGPYEPDELGKMAVFSPESLVCPEGRRGTSMGDWQRAGMIPDLSAALIRTGADDGGKNAVL